ncbi:MAG TPA: hypothetical protein VNB64_05270 [Solirubrobacteraceae bacterium]|nr:hypothetical protein [Solirubrobacteraceae bacterium]
MGRRIALAGLLAVVFTGATAQAVEPGSTYWHAEKHSVTNVQVHSLIQTATPNRIDVHEVTFTVSGTTPAASHTRVVLYAAVRTSGSAACPGAGWTFRELRRVVVPDDGPPVQLRFDPPLRVEGSNQEVCFAFQQTLYPNETELAVGASGFIVPPPPPPPPPPDPPNTVTVTETRTVTTEVPATDGRAPTTGLSGPASTRLRRPTFLLTSDEAGSTFRCKLDAAPYRRCPTPFRTALLRLGHHTLRVQAVDAARNVDRTPATKRFRILAPLRRR